MMNAEVREYKIIFVNSSGHEFIPTIGRPDFSGIGVYDASTQILKLSGERDDWASFASVLPAWSTPDYRVTSIEKDEHADNVIRIKLTRFFDYYNTLLTHYKHYQSLAGEHAGIYLSYDGNDTKFDPTADYALYRMPYHYEDVQIVYAENPLYYRTQVGFCQSTRSFPIPELKLKSTKKVSITISNRELQLKEVRFGYTYGEVGRIESERLGILPIEIEWKPGKALWIKISASGYVTFENKYSTYPDSGRIEIELKRTWFKKLSLPIVLFVWAFFMFGIGGYCVYKFDQKKISEFNRVNRQINNENDSLMAVVAELNDIIRIQQRQLQEKSAKTPEENKKEAEKKQNRIKQLRSELLTQYFTQEDIDEYKRLIGGVDKYSIAAENCLYIINVKDRKERGTIWTPGTPLNKKMEEAGQVLPGFYNKIMKYPSASNHSDGKYKDTYERTKVPIDGFRYLGDAYRAYESER